MAGTSPAMTWRGHGSSQRKSTLPVLLLRKIEQLAAHQIHRRLVVLLDVVERVGDDFGEPHEARLHVLEEEQVHGAEDEAANPDRKPDQRGVVREGREILVRLKQAEC